MLSGLLAKQAAERGASTALESGDVRLTYAELADRASRLAGGLSELGIGRGDSVVILLPNVPEHVVSFFALASLGAGAVLVDPGSKEHELRGVMSECSPSAVITDQKGIGTSTSVADELGMSLALVSVGAAPSGAHPIERLLRSEPVSPPSAPLDDELALYQYSSGSTGRAKRVGRTQAQVLAESRLVPETLDLTPDDTILCALPLFHAYAFGDCMLAALGCGGRLLFQPHPQPFSVRRAQTIDLIERERVTVFPAVPYMIDLLTTAPGDGNLSSLRYLFTAGTALPEAAATAFHDRYGVPVRQIYGCTESPSISVDLDPAPLRSARTVGRPFIGVEIVVRGEDGEPLPPGSVGEVGARSPAASGGYVGETYGDVETFRRGWVFPGDRGLVDDEGRLTIVGRTKLFIDVHGRKVDPIEVEDVLSLHPAVGEAVVVGTTGSKPGSTVVKAAVVVRADCTERELIHFCRERLALYKVPQVVEFLGEIPRSASGKVLRRELV